MADDTAHLIDTQPMLIFGCSSVELMSLAGLGFAGGLIVWLFLLAPFGWWFLSVPMGLLTSLATIVFGGRRLGKAKEGKPDGYFNRLLLSKLSRAGIKRSLVTRTGAWGVRRTMNTSITS